MQAIPSHKLATGSLSALVPVETSTLATRVYRGLREHLMAGQLAPGQKLTLRELAAALNVSPMPVRDAVRRLTTEGALEMLPNRRIRIPVMTKSRFAELLRIRLALEGLAVEEAVPHLGAAEIDQMEMLNAEFTHDLRAGGATTEQLIRTNQINKDFHFMLYEAARMPVLLATIEGLWLQVGPILHLTLPERSDRSGRPRTGTSRTNTNRSPDWHTGLIKALRQRDAQGARRALEGDLRSAADHILAKGQLPD